MNDTNQVILTGRTGQPIELRYSPKGMAIAAISLAVNESWTGDDGQKREKVHWFNLTAFDKTAENCAKYVGKGSQILVQGKLQVDVWDDKQTGQKRSAVKINVQRIQFLDTKEPGAMPAAPAPRTGAARTTAPLGSGGAVDPDDALF